MKKLLIFSERTILFRDNFFQGLKVTMRKHPKSFKLSGDLAERNKKLVDGSVVLYDGK